MKKRFFAALASLCVMMSALPMAAFAQGEPDSGTQTQSTLCEHHPSHDEACGYAPATEGTPCAFVCEVCNTQDSGDTATPSDAQPEECTCETLCTGEEINADCPVCSAEGAELDKVCVGAAPMLPVTALAAEGAPTALYVGNQVLKNSTSYWKTDPATGELTEYTEGGDAWNVQYNPETVTLTLRDATIKTTNTSGNNAVIYAQSNSQSAVSLTIELDGRNTIECASALYGIYVNAEMSNDSYGTDASLTITGNGSLEVSGSSYGIWVKSGTGNASLNIKNVAVTSSTNGNSAAGVCVQSSTHATSSPQLSLKVNGGSLTTSASEGNDGIQFYVGSSQAIGATTRLTISDNAIVDAKNGGISAKQISDPINTDISATSSNGGIVFDGTEGTVYGNVTLEEDLEIGEGESLTLDDGASLNTGDYTLKVDGGTLTGDVTGTVIYKVTSVSLNKDSLTLDVGESSTLTATITPDNASNKSINWESSNTGVATVDTSGKVTAVAQGTTTITATAADGSGKSAECSVMVNAAANVPVESVSLDKTNLELTEGGTETLTATITPDNATNKNVTWESSNTSVATVDADGKVTAVDAGTATITVTTVDGGFTDTCTVTVNPVQYTVTVRTDGNGTASASPATASAGTTVTLAADPDSGYHFERWEIVSGTVTISGSQFTMPAEHVTVKAVFDRNSSGGGSSGGSNSYREREYGFWMEVKDKIEDADPGDTIRVNARSYDRMPWSVMEALRNADGVTLHITWNGGEDILIPSAAALSERSRIYYPLSYLEDIDFTVEPEAPAYDTNKVNPGAGGILEVTAPAAAGSITAPAVQPEITNPQRGLAETPELAEEGIEQPLPGIYEPEEAVAATTDSTSPETGFSAVWIAVIAALAITAGGGVWFWKRRSAE